jgi:hypothetical protein
MKLGASRHWTRQHSTRLCWCVHTATAAIVSKPVNAVSLWVWPNCIGFNSTLVVGTYPYSVMHIHHTTINVYTSICDPDIVRYLNIWMTDFKFAEWLGNRSVGDLNMLQHIARWLNHISTPTWLAVELFIYLFIRDTVLRITAFHINWIHVQNPSTKSDVWLH